MSDANEKPKTGHEVIQSYLKTIDGSPGVYRMLDSRGQVLYVGNAESAGAGKQLRAAVGSLGPDRADDIKHRVDDVSDHEDRDRGVAA